MTRLGARASPRPRSSARRWPLHDRALARGPARQLAAHARDRRVSLALRLYDTSVAAGSAALEARTLPSIERLECARERMGPVPARNHVRPRARRDRPYRHGARVPWLSEQDAFSRLRGTLSTDRSEIIAAPGKETWLPHPDPAAALAACAYNLDEGPLRVSARTSPLFESLSFHARGGGIFYAVTDRAALRGVLDLVVMTRRQLDEAQANEDEDEPSRDVRIVRPGGKASSWCACSRSSRASAARRRRRRRPSPARSTGNKA